MNRPPEGGELDQGTVDIHTVDASGNISSNPIGYLWKRTYVKGYYAMLPGEKPPLPNDGVDTGYAFRWRDAWTSDPDPDPDDFVSWAEAKLGISSGTADKQYILESYPSWP